MAEIELTSGTLVVHIRGADRFLAMSSRVEVPLEHISEVDVAPPEAHDIWHGVKVGANLPGVVTAGRFLQGGEWDFWDVHDPAKAIAIHLHDEHYAKLVIGVDDAEGVAAQIREAIAHRA